ncbi:hypothetical protein D3C73_1385480 [compost metagenome]
MFGSKGIQRNSDGSAGRVDNSADDAPMCAKQWVHVGAAVQIEHMQIALSCPWRQSHDPLLLVYALLDMA